MKDPGPNASVDELLAAARDALTIDATKSIEFATRALEQQDSSAVQEVLALAHCHAGDGPNARLHFRKLRLNRQRRAVTDACIPLDIDILFTGQGLSLKEHAVRARKRFDAGDFDGAIEDAKYVLGEKYSPGMSELLAKSLCSKGDKQAGLDMAKRMAKVHATAVRAHCGE